MTNLYARITFSVLLLAQPAGANPLVQALKEAGGKRLNPAIPSQMERELRLPGASATVRRKAGTALDGQLTGTQRVEMLTAGNAKVETTILGEDYAASTYEFSKKWKYPLSNVKVSGADEFPSNEVYAAYKGRWAANYHVSLTSNELFILDNATRIQSYGFVKGLDGGVQSVKISERIALPKDWNSGASMSVDLTAVPNHLKIYTHKISADGNLISYAGDIFAPDEIVDFLLDVTGTKITVRCKNGQEFEYAIKGGERPRPDKLGQLAVEPTKHLDVFKLADYNAKVRILEAPQQIRTPQPGGFGFPSAATVAR